ncbi:MAG: hypothetical protein ACRETT_03715 [Steroidobacteraceae bacterium]
MIKPDVIAVVEQLNQLPFGQRARFARRHERIAAINPNLYDTVSLEPGQTFGPITAASVVQRHSVRVLADPKKPGFNNLAVPLQAFGVLDAKDCDVFHQSED